MSFNEILTLFKVYIKEIAVSYVVFNKQLILCNGSRLVDIHNVIGKLPRPKRGFVLPSHKYTGPYNPLDEQLDENDNPLPGQEPYNAVDAISMHHDICYRDYKNKKRK